jgi:PhoPQ-activated pathogenicity-related protein
LIVDELAHNSHQVTISMMQIPNCPLEFRDDPQHRGREEDDLIALSWLEFLENPDDPKWLVWLPMVKASYQGMRAAQEFLKEKGIADV